MAAKSASGLSRLFTSFTEGGTPVRATIDEGREEIGPSWSPSGDRLAYVSQNAGGWRLSMIRVGSSEPPVALEDSTWNSVSEWSPTGEWIAVGSATARCSIVFVSPDGRARREAGSKDALGHFAWSRDGRTLYMINTWGPHAGWVTAIDVASGKERVVRDLGGLDTGDFTPPGERISVSADGKALICRVSRSRGEIWLLDGVRTPEPWYARLWPW